MVDCLRGTHNPSVPGSSPGEPTGQGSLPLKYQAAGFEDPML